MRIEPWVYFLFESWIWTKLLLYSHRMIYLHFTKSLAYDIFRFWSLYSVFFRWKYMKPYYILEALAINCKDFLEQKTSITWDREIECCATSLLCTWSNENGSRSQRVFNKNRTREQSNNNYELNDFYKTTEFAQLLTEYELLRAVWIQDFFEVILRDKINRNKLERCLMLNFTRMSAQRCNG